MLKAQIVVLVVLIAIFSGQSIVRLMTEAAVGSLPPRLILLFLTYSLPNVLGYLFPLTLYVAIIITLGRICSDSEMVVMRAVGYSSVRIMIVTLLLGLLSAIIVGSISIDLKPRAANASFELEQQAATNPEFLPIASGRFVSFGRFNIYVENVSGLTTEQKEASNIYVIENGNSGVLSIASAQEGHLTIDEDGVRWLVLKNGRRYEYLADGSYRQAMFSDFKAPISGNVTEETRNANEMSRMYFSELLASPDIEAHLEAQWRIAPILATLVLCMIAVPLSMVNPRQGRFARLLPAIIIYLAYYLFLMSIRNLINTGFLPLYPGLYLVPLLFVLFVGIPLNMPKIYRKRDKTQHQAQYAAAGLTVATRAGGMNRHSEAAAEAESALPQEAVGAKLTHDATGSHDAYGSHDAAVAHDAPGAKLTHDTDASQLRQEDTDKQPKSKE